jgi:hypothetical protein
MRLRHSAILLFEIHLAEVMQIMRKWYIIVNKGKV